MVWGVRKDGQAAPDGDKACQLQQQQPCNTVRVACVRVQISVIVLSWRSAHRDGNSCISFPVHLSCINSSLTSHFAAYTTLAVK